MIIIIDGYNVLKQHAPGMDVGHTVRTRFIAQLAQYARRKDHTVIVVFDGGPYQWVFKETVNGITVVYSGERKTADDIIKGYLDQYRQHEALLVSSDRELNSCAQAFGVTSINSRDFYHILCQGAENSRQEKKVTHGAVIKLTQDTLPEVDELMKSMVGAVPIKKEDSGGHDVKDKHKKAPKEERMLLKKLKKL